MSFKSVGGIILSVAEILQPSEELSVSQAAEKYRYVNQPGAYVGPWMNSTTPMMVEPMDVFTSREYNGEIFVGPAQSGKPLALDTPVATPTGWSSIGALSVGDEVFNLDGVPTQVTYITPVFTHRKCYKITFDDGAEIVCDEVHRWAVNDMWAPDPYVFVVKETRELVGKFKVITSRGTPRFRFSIPVAMPLELPAKELPIHPYLLGVWLGDGSRCDGGLALGNQDVTHITKRIEELGYELMSLGKGNAADTCKRAAFRCKRSGMSLTKILEREGLLKNKHIPEIYLRASVKQRMELMKGLLDTDGTIGGNSGRVVFTQSLEVLFNQCNELAHSLGVKTMCHVDQPTYVSNGIKLKGALCYSMEFNVGDIESFVTLPRHIEKHRKYRLGKTTRPTHAGRRFIRNIEPVESVPVKCISVADDMHLFLVGKELIPTHNTDSLIINTVAYTVKVEPMDTMIVCPTMTAGRDFSIRRIDRLHRHSQDIGKMMLAGADYDNKFDKHYINGMLLTISWPTPTELAGKPIGRIVMTDFDRMPMDVDGDGNPYDLASKRTTTFGSYAMTLAESSPSKPVENLKWIPHSAHEAPPCEGILALYNRGDRRRWYWPCLECGGYFEGRFEMLTYEKREGLTNLEISETVRMKCPHCAHSIHTDEREQMNARGVWLKDGQGIDKDGTIFGPKPRTSIASFWLRGVAAVFTNWKKLLELYLNADDEFQRTGSQEALRKFYNNDLGEPYYEKGSNDLRLPETIKSRAEPLRERHVPKGVRFLVALVDVQKNMFVVQVMGILPGRPFDTVIVDRYDVRKSQRTDDDGERLWVKPGSYLQDWEELTEHVLKREYPVDDDTGRMMGMKFVGCDSGGQEGVTTMAYNYYRALRERNEHRRFILIKGDPKPGQPRCRIGYPDSNRRDAKSAARGDVPVLFLQSNLLKDDLNGRLDVMEPGKGMYRMPNWLDDKFFAELCAEVREAKGWTNANSHRNESWDLSYYCIGLCVSELIRVEHLNWESPPSWASEWEDDGWNDLVRKPLELPTFANTIKSSYDFSSFGKALA